MKAIVGMSGVVAGTRFAGQPTATYLILRAKERHIGLDVQERRAIYHIHIQKMHRRALNPLHPHQ